MRDAGFAFGGALLTTALEALGRLAWNGPYLPELMAQKLFTLIPVWAFTPLFRTFGYNSKYYTFAAMIGVEIGGLTLGGYVLRRWMRRRLAGWGSGRLVAAVAGLLAAMILLGLLPLLDAGVAGRAITGGPWITVPTIVAAAACYAAVLARRISP